LSLKSVTSQKRSRKRSEAEFKKLVQLEKSPHSASSELEALNHLQLSQMTFTTSTNPINEINIPFPHQCGMSDSNSITATAFMVIQSPSASHRASEPSHRFFVCTEFWFRVVVE